MEAPRLTFYPFLFFPVLGSCFKLCRCFFPHFCCLSFSFFVSFFRYDDLFFYFYIPFASSHFHHVADIILLINTIMSSYCCLCNSVIIGRQVMKLWFYGHVKGRRKKTIITQYYENGLGFCMNVNLLYCCVFKGIYIWKGEWIFVERILKFNGTVELSVFLVHLRPNCMQSVNNMKEDILYLYNVYILLGLFLSPMGF